MFHSSIREGPDGPSCAVRVALDRGSQISLPHSGLGTPSPGGRGRDAGPPGRLDRGAAGVPMLGELGLADPLVVRGSTLATFPGWSLALRASAPVNGLTEEHHAPIPAPRR